MANRLADIFADLESQLIANQKAVFQSYPNTSLADVTNFQLNMRANQSMLEQVNVQAVNNAYRQAASYMNEAITKGYNRGVTSVSSQLDTDINNEENERARALKSNANSVVSSMCRIAISSAMGAFSGIVSAVSVYNQAQDLYQAIDQAQSQYLEKGVVGSVNTNGAQTNIETFADIVEGEFDHNATLTGEGHARDETGNYYVVVSSHFGCCEKCAKWENVVLIDDWKANGKPDGVHPLLSDAVSQGLFHPNCRHRTRVVLQGEEKRLKGDFKETWTKKENSEQYQAEQKQRRYEREIRKYKRLEQGSLTQSEQLKAHQKVLEYQKKQREHIKASNQQDGVKLFRQYEREQIGGETKPQVSPEFQSNNDGVNDFNYLRLPYKERQSITNYISSDAYKINSQLRNGEVLDDNYKEMTNNLINALEKLPKVKNQTLVRDIYINDEELWNKFYNDHIVSEEISYHQFISATTKDAYNEDFNVRIYFLDANKATDLTKVNNQEAEALYSIDEPFMVLTKQKKNGKIFIWMKEK